MGGRQGWGGAAGVGVGRGARAMGVGGRQGWVRDTRGRAGGRVAEWVGGTGGRAASWVGGRSERVAGVDGRQGLGGGWRLPPPPLPPPLWMLPIHGGFVVELHHEHELT